MLVRLDQVRYLSLMLTTNIYEAKTNLSKLIEYVLSGKEVVIAKAGKPVAKLTPYLPSKEKRKPGLLKGKIMIPDDFDDESEEINKLFYGSKLTP